MVSRLSRHEELVAIEEAMRRKGLDVIRAEQTSAKKRQTKHEQRFQRQLSTWWYKKVRERSAWDAIPTIYFGIEPK